MYLGDFMVIGIDIDGVLNDYLEFCRIYGTKFCKENNIYFDKFTPDYETTVMFGWSDEAETKFWDEHLDLYVKYPARKGASKIIKKLKDDGHTIKIITKRVYTELDNELGKQMRDAVKNWLQVEDIYHDKLVFCGKSKIPNCHEEKIDVLIDDWITNINEVSKECCPVIIFNTGYNLDCNPSNTYRVNSWEEIYELINSDKFLNEEK